MRFLFLCLLVIANFALPGYAQKQKKVKLNNYLTIKCIVDDRENLSGAGELKFYVPGKGNTESISETFYFDDVKRVSDPESGDCLELTNARFSITVGNPRYKSATGGTFSFKGCNTRVELGNEYIFIIADGGTLQKTSDANLPANRRDDFSGKIISPFSINMSTDPSSMSRLKFVDGTVITTNKVDISEAEDDRGYKLGGTNIINDIFGTYQVYQGYTVDASSKSLTKGFWQAEDGTMIREKGKFDKLTVYRKSGGWIGQEFLSIDGETILEKEGFQSGDYKLVDNEGKPLHKKVNGREFLGFWGIQKDGKEVSYKDFLKNFESCIVVPKRGKWLAENSFDEILAVVDNFEEMSVKEYENREQKAKEAAAKAIYDEIRDFVGTWTNTDNAKDGSYRLTNTVTVYADGTAVRKCKGYYKYIGIAPLTGAKLLYEYNWTSESPRLNFFDRKEKSISVVHSYFDAKFKYTGTRTINGAQKKSLTKDDVMDLEMKTPDWDVLTFGNGVLKDNRGRVFRKSGAK